MLMGDRVRLVGEMPGAFKDYAIIGANRSRGLWVALIAPWEDELAPVYTFNASALVWDPEGECWLGKQPPPRVEPDRSRIVLQP